MTDASQQYDGRIRYSSSPAARLAGFALMVTGGLAMLSSLVGLLSSGVTFLRLLAGPSVVLVGFLMVSSYEGITLDARTKRYRVYQWILGFRHGEWQALPNVVRVTVSPFNAAYVMNDAIAPSMTVQRQGLYRVLLSIENARIGIIAAIARQDQALEKAARIASLFGVEVTSTLQV
ncbi:hypothetical protein LJY25_09480 [Hymenobacter sp. BT175]|uniref:hypothetical protein n=1 Tax=Hymenobacter translucens TaxID=2886507 RepID=UPI001D0DD6D7|nr:hypothetical protein [Hymenobacter translucens]MCC2546671.1 hypothetical protein [Hymenobacter translucens]